MSTYERHYVTFHSPGSFFDETTTKPIPEWSPKLACQLLSDVVERYDSKPYGFSFSTYIEHDPIETDRGTLKVEPKLVTQSKLFYINGIVETAEEVEVRGDPNESILLSNMKCNDFKVCITHNSWKHCGAFREGDCVVNSEGEVVYPKPESLATNVSSN